MRNDSCDESIGVTTLFLLEYIWFGSVSLSYLPFHRYVLKDSIAILEEIECKYAIQLKKKINSDTPIYIQNSK